ncbi:MAG: class I SAM-dependent methyltransferase [Rhizobiaceae bacterium]
MTVLDHAGLMDKVYRHQRHFYDATRKFYLIGRDPMLIGLDVPEGGTVLEIGCGTGRNLVKAGRLYQTAKLFGIDISREMLVSAGKAVFKAGIERRSRLAYADAASFDPQRVFDRETFDRVFISYAVSMIPSWQAVIERAVEQLAPGGELHIVDFGDLRGLPGWSKSMLHAWLTRFHVTPRALMFRASADIAAANGCEFEERRLYRGFTWIAVIRRPENAVVQEKVLETTAA